MKIQLKNLKTITVKYNKQPIKIRPYISRTDMLALTQLALDNYFSNTETLQIDRFSIISQVKVGFDIAVITTCTDLDISGVETDDFVASGIIDIIAPHISNYQVVWELIMRAISDKVLYDGLELIAKSIPSDKNINKSVKDMSGVLEELKNNPELFEKVMSAVKLNAAKVVAKSEVEKSKKKA
jgi:hypothetical protein